LKSRFFKLRKAIKVPIEPKRIVIVGAGGVGGWLGIGLAMMAETNAPGSAIIFVDGDNYEEKNKSRQDFNELGNKASVKANELQPKYPNTFIAGDPRWVVENVKNVAVEEDGSTSGVVAASDLLKEGDVVFAVVDNFAARKIIFDAAQNVDNIDVFTGGNDDAFYGTVYHYQRREGKDVSEHPVEWHPELLNPPDRNPGELSCEERAKIEGGTQFVATNMAVASYLLARASIVIFEGREDNRHEIMFDLEHITSLSEDRRPELVPANS
jgi:hypothetical protein